MYERILVPLDGSELSETILPYVEPVAQKFGSEVILVRVVTAVHEAVGEAAGPIAPEVGVSVGYGRVDAETEASERYMAKVIDRLRQAGIPARAVVISGQPASAIVDAAEETDASLIAMATHGRGGLSKLVFGSVAEEVVRGSRTPVLVKRPEG